MALFLETAARLLVGPPPAAAPLTAAQMCSLQGQSRGQCVTRSCGPLRTSPARSHRKCSYTWTEQAGSCWVGMPWTAVHSRRGTNTSPSPSVPGKDGDPAQVSCRNTSPSTCGDALFPLRPAGQSLAQMAAQAVACCVEVPFLPASTRGHGSPRGARHGCHRAQLRRWRVLSRAAFLEDSAPFSPESKAQLCWGWGEGARPRPVPQPASPRLCRRDDWAARPRRRGSTCGRAAPSPPAGLCHARHALCT